MVREKEQDSFRVTPPKGKPRVHDVGLAILYLSQGRRKLGHKPTQLRYDHTDRLLFLDTYNLDEVDSGYIPHLQLS
jgi:hypothetical protein